MRVLTLWSAPAEPKRRRLPVPTRQTGAMLAAVVPYSIDGITAIPIVLACQEHTLRMNPNWLSCGFRDWRQDAAATAGTDARRYGTPGARQRKWRQAFPAIEAGGAAGARAAGTLRERHK